MDSSLNEVNENNKITNRSFLADAGYEDAIIFENPSYDDAIIGITVNGSVVYDFDLMVECLVKEDGITPEEAIEFIDYNTIRSLDYFSQENKPIIIYSIENFK